MRYFIHMGKNEITSCPDGVGFKCPGEYYDTREDAQEELDAVVEVPLSDEEQYFLQREFEYMEVLKDFFKKAPNQTEDELITLFAETAFALYQGKD